MKETLGSNNVKLGRMDIDVANAYNEGVEQFLNDYPEMRGFVKDVDNKVGQMNNARCYGQAESKDMEISFSTEYKGIVNGGTLHLSSNRTFQQYNDSIKKDIEAEFHYEGMSIKSVAYHEMVHLAEYQIHDKQSGHLDSNNKPLVRIKERPKLYYNPTISTEIVNQAKMDVFGKLEGPEVLEGTKFLGKYSYTNSMETLAEAISYERTSGYSNKYSKRITELFDKKYKEVMRGK